MVLDDEIPALAGLFGDGHAEARVDVGGAGLRGASLVEGQALVVDGGHGARPARQGLLEFEVDRVHDVVAVAREERVWFLVVGEGGLVCREGG